MSQPSESAGPFGTATPTGGPVLATQNVRRSFQIGNRTLEVLHGIDLELRAGERLGLVGSSGAGKSTLLHHIGLLDRPSSGEVLIEGHKAWDLGPGARSALRNQKIGFVFQQFHLLPELSAIENVVLPGMIAAGRKRRKQLTHKAKELLVEFGLGERIKHRPAQLSGGEKQRVAIAWALILDPPILIADEPTGNLDSATGSTILDLIFAEQERRTLSLLLVTHDEQVTSRCDRVLGMKDGRIVSETLRDEPVRDHSEASDGF